MGRSPYFFVERPDRNTGKYEMQHPIVWNYNHTKQEPADLFPYNGCHDLFSIVENNGTGNDFPTMRGIHRGLPENVAAEIKEAYCNEEKEDPPKKIMMPTPLKSLMNRVDAFLEVMDGWDWRDDYSQIRIVYWIE